MTKGFQTLT